MATTSQFSDEDLIILDDSHSENKNGQIDSSFIIEEIPSEQNSFIDLGIVQPIDLANKQNSGNIELDLSNLGDTKNGNNLNGLNLGLDLEKQASGGENRTNSNDNFSLFGDDISKGQSSGGGDSSFSDDTTLDSILDGTIAKLEVRKSNISHLIEQKENEIKDIDSQITNLQEKKKNTEEEKAKLDTESKKISTNIKGIEKMKSLETDQTKK